MQQTKVVLTIPLSLSLIEIIFSYHINLWHIPWNIVYSHYYFKITLVIKAATRYYFFDFLKNTSIIISELIFINMLISFSIIGFLLFLCILLYSEEGSISWCSWHKQKVHGTNKRVETGTKLSQSKWQT